TGTSLQWKKNGVNILGATASSYTVTAKGTYTCETSSACGTALSSGITILVNKKPAASITAGGPTSFCAGDSVVLTANAGVDLSYQWLQGTTPIVGATAISYTAVTAGNYKCSVTRTSTGCSKTSNKITVTIPCREGDNEMGDAVTIFPNPATDKFILQAQIQGATITIYNSVGEVMYTKEVHAQKGFINETIELQNISAGIYFVFISSAEKFYEQKLIVH
ncbi:MAG: T9SS type A sorting domain-containing protein, partial [Chitinophagales bacterium]